MFASTSAMFDQFQPLTPREIEIAWLGLLAGRGDAYSGFGKEIEARRKRRAAIPGMKAKLRARGRKPDVFRDVATAIVRGNNRTALTMIFFDVGKRHNLPTSTVKTYWYKTPSTERKKAIANARLLEQG